MRSCGEIPFLDSAVSSARMSRPTLAARPTSPRAAPPAGTPRTSRPTRTTPARARCRATRHARLSSQRYRRALKRARTRRVEEQRVGVRPGALRLRHGAVGEHHRVRRRVQPQSMVPLPIHGRVRQRQRRQVRLRSGAGGGNRPSRNAVAVRSIRRWRVACICRRVQRQRRELKGAVAVGEAPRCRIEGDVDPPTPPAAWRCGCGREPAE